MTIPSFKILKKNASERVAAAENSKKIVLIYAGAVTVLALLVTVVNYILRGQISQMGGLSNMGLRSILSTIQQVLPMIQSFVVMCLELGYVAAMVRIARQQFASEKTLKLGFDRFFVLLRHTLIQGAIYSLAAMAAFWLALQIYLITPLSGPILDLLTPIVSDPGFTQEMLLELMQDQVLGDQIMAAMTPMFLIFGLIYLMLFLPISYSLRMSKYVIIDKPGMGAIYAMKESKKMMKGSCIRLLKLDISLWWWYAISFVSMVLCYGDSLLPMVGITLPFSETVSYFLFYGLFLAVQFVACIFLRNRVEVVYAQVYNALKPREKDSGVVLGNIFQM